MPITANNKDVVATSFGAISIAYIYKGATLVWQMIRSCFGNGFWINLKPWLNDNAWKNN